MTYDKNALDDLFSLAYEELRPFAETTRVLTPRTADRPFRAEPLPPSLRANRAGRESVRGACVPVESVENRHPHVHTRCKTPGSP